MFDLRSVYNFNVYPATILGSDFNNVTVMSVIGPEDAAREIDIYAMHAQVYPYLSGVPNDPTAYDYVRIKTPAGNTIILGLTWINQSTIVKVTSPTVTVTLTGISPTEIQRLKNILALNNLGYNSISVA